MLNKFSFLIFIIFLFTSCDRGTTLSKDIIKSNIVYNYSDHKNIDNIIYIGLDYLNLDSINVSVFNIPEMFKVVENNNDYYVVRGFIIENCNNSYIIYLNNYIDRDGIILTIAHELIHLKQYNNDRLIITEYNNGVYFDNIFYFTDFLEYKKRPWEIEAFKEQDSLYNHILNP